MTRHVSEWDEDEQRWPTVACSCGWGGNSFPDTETAADAWGDHMYDVGYQAGHKNAQLP